MSVKSPSNTKTSPSSTILVPLAEGFEECEAITIIDILRRASLTVIVAGLNGTPITGAHGIRVECDTTLDQVNRKALSGIVLPGGQPGTSNLLKSSLIRDIIIDLDRQEQMVAAICAAPTVLLAAGILSGRKVTSFPACEKEFDPTLYQTDAFVEDGNVVTGRALGTALPFSLKLVQKLCGNAKAEEIRRAVLG